MKRTAAISPSSCCKPQSDAIGGSLPSASARGAESKVKRPSVRYRSDFRPPERPTQSQRRIGGKPANHVEPVWEVLDDLPELVPVTEREIQVIETYLAALPKEPE